MVNNLLQQPVPVFQKKKGVLTADKKGKSYTTDNTVYILKKEKEKNRNKVGL